MRHQRKATADAARRILTEVAVAVGVTRSMARCTSKDSIFGAEVLLSSATTRLLHLAQLEWRTGASLLAKLSARLTYMGS